MTNGTTPLRRAVSTLARPGGRSPAELVDYAEGFKKMKALGNDKVNSLFYQAAIHGLDGEPHRRNPDFDWCQHQSWFFFPWHRMYLVEFERIIGSLIGKPSWRIPYWDYTADSSLPSSPTWSMPPEFVSPPSSANPLFVRRRATSLTKDEREWETAMRATVFASPPILANGFGGGEVTTPAQFAGMRTGTAEGQPHNTVHRIVGGLMRDPFTAARDPIFWLHHACIDRLWEIWLRMQDHSNPAVAAWLDTTFTFPTAAEPLKIRDVLDTEALGYAYDDVTPPAVPLRVALSGVAPTPRAEEASMEQAREPELLGATDGPMPLDPGATLAVRVEPAQEWRMTGRMAEAGLLAEAADTEAAATEMALEGDVYLQLENVRGVEPAVGVYGVYVNVPEGGDPADHPELRAGLFSTFGLEAATAAGHGMTQAFDITDVARHLYNEGRWDAANVNVSLTSHAAIEERDPAAHDVTVERVSVYVVPPV